MRVDLRCLVGIVAKLGNPLPSAGKSAEGVGITRGGSTSMNIHYFMKYCNTIMKQSQDQSDIIGSS
jgi:hypothetical protein